MGSTKGNRRDGDQLLLNRVTHPGRGQGKTEPLTGELASASLYGFGTFAMTRENAWSPTAKSATSPEGIPRHNFTRRARRARHAPDRSALDSRGECSMATGC